jgi:hypothetical protein
MISQAERRDIWMSATATMREWYGDSLAQQGACLYWNQIAMRELAMRGYRPVLQAGDMHWRIVSPQHDDGECATHFGYEFDLSQPFSQEALARGLFPECHVWACLPEENCLVDFSVSYLPKLAKERHGYNWLAPLPPAYVFGGVPMGAIYIPKVDAIKFVWRFIAAKLAPEKEREMILAVVQ